MLSLRRRTGLLAPWLAASLVAAVPAVARADDDDPVARAMTEIRNNDDSRVRTQAALALGRSRDKRAVAALCDGLDDTSLSVRLAAAAAIGTLSLGGKDCLKSHLDGEPNPSVKASIQKAIDKLKLADHPTIGADTKYYVAVGPTTDKSGRSGTDIDDLVHAQLEQAAAQADGYVVAPRDEKPSDAKPLLAKHQKVKGFFLWPKVFPLDYTNGNLTIRIELSVFTYPGKALKGTIARKIKMEDVGTPDPSTENDLIKQVAARAFQDFSSDAERLAQ